MCEHVLSEHNVMEASGLAGLRLDYLLQSALVADIRSGMNVYLPSVGVALREIVWRRKGMEMKTSRGVLIAMTSVVALGLAAPCFAQEDADAKEPVITAPTAPADDAEAKKPRKPRLTLKPSASVFWPSSDKAKGTFGNAWQMIGVAIDYRDDDRSKSRLQLQLDSISRTSGADHARVFPIGIKYTERANASRTFSPYFGATASWCVADVKSTLDGVDTGLRSAGVGGSAFVGANVGMNLKVEATYHKFPEIRGFDLSGFSIGATLQF